MGNETEKMINALVGIVSLMLVINLLLITSSPTLGITGFATAQQTAQVDVTVLEAASITIAAGGDVNFGVLEVGESKDTTTLGSSITLENNGSVDVNITATSTQIFTTTGTYDELTCKATCGSGCSTDWVETSYVNCYNGTAPKIVGCLDEPSGSDQVVVDLNIFVPENESSGDKSGTVTFTASAC